MQIKLTTFILLIAATTVSARGYSQQITLSENNAPLTRVMHKIEKQTGYQFLFFDGDILRAKKVTINVKNAGIGDVLQQCFKGQPLTYKIAGNTIVIGLKASPSPVPADTTLNVHGRIMNEKGQPISGATIRVKGLDIATATDSNGEFTLDSLKEDAVLICTSIGYETKQIKLNGQHDIIIQLQAQINKLGGVEVTVSTGYQDIPKERATGSFTQIDNKLFNEQVSTNILERLPSIANSLNIIPNRIFNSSPIITIRGLSTISLGIAKPLIVIDGFPYEGDISNINPSDVEKITILKDAAAASIWGVRAGNGVIVITMKKGQFNQKIGVEVSSNVTVINKPDLFKIKNIATSDFIDVEKFLFSNHFYDDALQYSPYSYQTPVIDILDKQLNGQITSDQANAQINALRNIDVRNAFNKYFYQRGINQQYAINLHGGSNNLAWLVAMGYDNNMDNLDAPYKRLNIRSENTYRPVKNLLLHIGIYFTQSNSSSGKPAYGSLSTQYGNIPPYTRFADVNGAPLPMMTYYRKGFIDTAGEGKLLDWNYYPLENYKHEQNNSGIQDVIGSIGLNYTLLEGLSLDIKYQYEQQMTAGSTLYDQESYYARDLINSFSQIDYNSGQVMRPVPMGSIFDLSSSKLASQDARGQINFNRSWDKSSINIIGGSEIRSVNIKGNSYRTYGYDDNNLTFGFVDYQNQYPLFITNLGTNFIPNPANFTSTLNRFISYYVNGAYTYNNKYVISLSGRRDASNLFGVSTNDKWKPLWSAGMAWNISNEDFFDIPLISYLKLRVTYGYSGNIDPGKSGVPTIEYFDVSPYTQSPVARVAVAPNPDLRWEKVGMANFGMDFKLTGNVLGGSIEYYRKNGTDLYSFVPVDLTLGLNAPFISKNAASMRGNGIDIELRSTNIDREFKWFSTLNLNYYKDKVSKYAASSLAGNNFVGGKGGAIEGYPLFSLFTYKWMGLDPATGDPQGFLNGKISKDYYDLINDSIQHLTYNGSALPTFFGSFGNTFSWENFSLTARFVFELGYYFERESINYNNLYYNLNGNGDFVNRWRKSGDEKFTNVPSMVYPNDANRDLFYNNSAILATRGDNIRLKYLNLSYNIQAKHHQKSSINSIRIYIVASDLGIIWRANKYGIDPDYSNSQLPPPTSISIGIQANL